MSTRPIDAHHLLSAVLRFPIVEINMGLPLEENGRSQERPAAATEDPVLSLIEGEGVIGPYSGRRIPDGLVSRR